MMVAIRKAFAANGALNADDVVQAVARLLGFTRAGARIDEAIRTILPSLSAAASFRATAESMRSIAATSAITGAKN